MNPANGSPRSRRGRRTRQRTALLTLALLLATAWSAGFRAGGFFRISDSSQYLALAQGEPGMSPFAMRQMAPLVARGLAYGLHAWVETGFAIEGALALICLACCVVWLLIRANAPGWLMVAVAGLFFWSQQIGGLALPDLPHAALLSLLLVLLERRRTLAATLLLAPLAFTRESTVLVLVCLLAAGRRRLRPLELATACAATAVGLALATHRSADALPNHEHIPAGLYLVAKVPWNLCRNVLGATPWANVYRSCAVPRWSVPLHLGPLRAVGLCGFDPSLPVNLALWALALFGLLPLLLLRVRRRALSLYRDGDLLLRFSLLYGAVSYLLGGVLGFSVGRLLAYAWPLCLVGLPRLLDKTPGGFRSQPAAWGFVGLHLGLSWLVFEAGGADALLAAVLAWVAGAWLLRRFWIEPEVQPPAAPGDP